MSRPVLNVTIGTRVFPGGPWKARIYQQEYGFDVCVLTVPRLAASTTAFAKGTPVTVSYGRTQASLASFPGYIHHVVPKRDQNTGEANIVCIGASSKGLRDSASRVWPVGSSASIAVQQIVGGLHLSSLTEPTPVVAPGGPVNESWWSYITRAAKECGFTCYASGTDVRFHSRRIDASGDPVPYFVAYTDVKTRANNVVITYRASDSDDTAGDSPHRKRRAFGVTDEGLTVALTDVGDLESVAGVTQELPSLTHNENIVVHDLGTASDRLRATQETSRFTRQSKFVVSGNESVRQASTTVIRGIRDDLDGYWYVMSVVHNLSSAAYSMDMVCGRDGVGDNAPVDLTAPVAVIDLGRSEPIPAPTPVLRINGNSAGNLVFPTTAADWMASNILHRQHFPWRSAVRG